MSEIAKHYTSGKIEEKWYAHWMANKYFESTPDDREPYTIVIPPPNVTGILHMGHILNNTIQDFLIRKARMEGKNACWVPGLDHASIATEAKVVKLLREQGLKKSDLSREEFLTHAWAWKEKYGGIILQQLQKLGASCDWSRTAFTMDEVRSKATFKVFVDLYNKGKLYRKLRMINWDPEAQTVLSNEEVIYHEEDANLYYVIYPIVDENGQELDEYLTIATTRPETILGDTGVAVHPDDARYAHLKGKSVKVPMVNRVVPIIFDDYVDQEFGTGALKITPAHDTNDYAIGERHGLETIDVLNPDGTISEAGQLFVGMDRDEARIAAKVALKETGQLEKIDRLRHNVGRSERTNSVVEPRLSLQWFVDMKALSEPALKAVMEDDIRFFPEKFKNTYSHWMENIRDWCISRQLWWGHRIPAWYVDSNDGQKIFVKETAEEALKQAREELGDHVSMSDLKQDEDVLDTWFSSWLWPISVFDGFETKEEVDYYYPTKVLVTGWDIIFQWVARMIMAGSEWREEKPFEHVYFTGMVRDKQRRKMSKSLGNSPDALELIEKYGADGVRYGILYSSPVGGDLLFDDGHVEQGRNFCNKIWNALKFVKGLQVEDKATPKGNKFAIEWFESLSQKAIQEVNEKVDQYRLSDALMTSYKYVWGEFCSNYLEMIKPAYGDTIDRNTYDQTIQFFSRICRLLHPFMPFITEEVWHLLDGEVDTDCVVSAYPKASTFDETILADMQLLLTVKTKILEIRNKQQMDSKLSINAGRVGEEAHIWSRSGANDILAKFTKLDSFDKAKAVPSNTFSFVVGQASYYVVSNKEVDTEEVKKELTEDLIYYQGFLGKVEKKLSNERFVSNAPAAVVEKENQKKEDALAKISELEKQLENL